MSQSHNEISVTFSCFFIQTNETLSRNSWWLYILSFKHQYVLWAIWCILSSIIPDHRSKFILNCTPTLSSRTASLSPPITHPIASTMWQTSSISGNVIQRRWILQTADRSEKIISDPIWEIKIYILIIYVEHAIKLYRRKCWNKDCI
jgi:hypothetical protein